MRYTGLDVHKQSITATTLTATGTILEQRQVGTDPQALARFAASFGPQDAIALESTTNAWPLYHLLRAHAGSVLISNPMQTKAIAAAKVKTDKVDSLVLAQLLRADYLPAVWVPDEATMRLRNLCSYREGLVRQRTQAKNRIHAVLHRTLTPVPTLADLFCSSGMHFLKQVSLPSHEQFVLDGELAMLQALNDQIKLAEHELARTAAQSKGVRLLLSLPGVSQQVAIGILAAVGDIARFAGPKKLVSYLGLDPLGQRSAGEIVGSNRISKRGRSHARWLLTEAATAAVRVPGPLQSFYLRLRRGKGHNKAIVAVARKLGCLAWRLLTDGVPYAWAPPVRTREKIRQFEILAGAPRNKTGPKRGQPSAGGRPAYLARRRADNDLLRLAQQQYEELMQLRAVT
jgi:transposase